MKKKDENSPHNRPTLRAVVLANPQDNFDYDKLDY